MLTISAECFLIKITDVKKQYKYKGLYASNITNNFCQLVENCLNILGGSIAPSLRGRERERLCPHNARGSPHRAAPLTANNLTVLFMFSFSTQNWGCQSLYNFVYMFINHFSMIFKVFYLLLTIFEQSHSKGFWFLNNFFNFFQ